MDVRGSAARERDISMDAREGDEKTIWRCNPIMGIASANVAQRKRIRIHFWGIMHGGA